MKIGAAFFFSSRFQTFFDFGYWLFNIDCWIFEKKLMS